MTTADDFLVRAKAQVAALMVTITELETALATFETGVGTAAKPGPLPVWGVIQDAATSWETRSTPPVAEAPPAVLPDGTPAPIVTEPLETSLDTGATTASPSPDAGSLAGSVTLPYGSPGPLPFDPSRATPPNPTIA